MTKEYILNLAEETFGEVSQNEQLKNKFMDKLKMKIDENSKSINLINDPISIESWEIMFGGKPSKK